MGTDNNEEEIKQNLQLKDKSADGTHNDEPADAMQEKTDTDGNRTDAAASPDPDAAGIEEKEQSGRNTGNSSRYMDPGAKWAAENAKATGSAGIPGHIVMILAAVLLIILCAVIYVSQKPEENAPGQASTAETAGTQEQSMGAREETGETANTAGQAQTAASGSTAGAEKSVALSPGMKALDKKLRKDLSEKNGDWSLYLYCLDNGQEIGINANEPMISASLIKLYVHPVIMNRHYSVSLVANQNKVNGYVVSQVIILRL